MVNGFHDDSEVLSGMPGYKGMPGCVPGPETKNSVKSGMDYLIDHLKKIKDEINETNARFFNIKSEQRRDLKPIMTFKGIVGFERQSGDIFSVIIEDNRKIGQPII